MFRLSSLFKSVFICLFSLSFAWYLNSAFASPPSANTGAGSQQIYSPEDLLPPGGGGDVCVDPVTGISFPPSAKCKCEAEDACGICGGPGPGECGCDLSIKKGCDGVCNSNNVPDACGVCGGPGPGECGCDLTKQKGCDGVCDSKLVPDVCGVCGGDGSSCANCKLVDCAGNDIQNASQFCHLDVNKDGTVNDKDVNEVKGYLNATGSRNNNSSNRHFDTSKDGAVTPNDVLQIINFINGPDSGDTSCNGCQLVDCAGNDIKNASQYCHLDVNKDGTIDNKDVNEVKGYLNTSGSGNNNSRNKHFDTSKDGAVTPNDVLQIINFINGPPSGVKTEDECGICGGAGINSCNKCVGDPDFIEDLGCGCDLNIKDLGCGCGKPAPGTCGCDLSIKDLGCGCGKAGPTGCDYKCGSNKKVDTCGVCDGDGSTCSNTCTAPCGCRPDGSPILHDECGRCGGMGKNSCGSCDLNFVDLGCGCGIPGPSGCDNKCGSSMKVDACGVCGGTSSVCCEYYTLSAANPGENVYTNAMRALSGQSYQLFTGKGAELSCLDQVVKDAVAQCYRDVPSKGFDPSEYAQVCEPHKIGKTYYTGYMWFADDAFYYKFFDPEFLRLAKDVDRMISHMHFSSLRDQLMWYYDQSQKNNYYTQTGVKLIAKYMDKNCRLIDGEVPANKICGDLKIDVLVSPISLEWDLTDSMIETKLVDFKVNPHSSSKLFEWKANSKFPLLAFDRNENGKVDDATELFGNWFMGGRMSSSLSGTKNYDGPWKNGYEALAVFDRNYDGKISDRELDEILLWFDANQNGVSEHGELFPIREKGISLLYYKLDHDIKNEGDIILEQGFERIENGKTIIGKTVDWYSKGYDSEIEAYNARSMESLLKNNSQNITQAVVDNLNSQKTDTAKIQSGVLDEVDKVFPDLEEVAKPKTDFTGTWYWVSKTENIKARNNNGIFGFIQKDFVVFGSSISETPLKISPTSSIKDDNLKSILTDTRIFGKVVRNKKGKEFLRFSTLLENSKNESLAYLSKDGKSLIGETHGEIIKGSNEKISIHYNWIAKLLPGGSK